MGQNSEESVRTVADKGLDAVEEKVLSGLDTAREVTENAADRTAEVHQRTQESVNELSQVVASYVQEKPLQAAGIAFAAGIVTTLLLTRRN